MTRPSGGTATADQPLAGQVAIVTGAGAGLGRSHALALSEMGAAIVVNDVGGDVGGHGESASAADEVVATIRGAGGRAVASAVSVARPYAGERIARTALEAFGRVDIVVTNAGILRDHRFAELDDQAWDGVIDVHLRGTYAVLRAAWPLLLDQDYGRIVVTTSAAGLFGNPGHANYGAAKAGIYGLMRMLAQETAGTGIRVNAIAPLALTRMSDSKGDRRRASDIAGKLFQQMSPAQVSPVVGWLAHPACESHGRAYSVGGGRVAEIFVGETRGWVDPGLTWRSVAEHWHDICAHDADVVPDGMADEIGLYLDALGTA